MAGWEFVDGVFILVAVTIVVLGKAFALIVGVGSGPQPVLCLEWVDNVVYAGGVLLISVAVRMAECSTERRRGKV